nr:MAG TPA: hypothetical protein [Caudoviricetes sp.]
MNYSRAKARWLLVSSSSLPTNSTSVNSDNSCHTKYI